MHERLFIAAGASHVKCAGGMEPVREKPAPEAPPKRLFPGRFVGVPALALEFLRERLDRAVVVLRLAA